jgi:cbb3-type cytochrome oxidase maturation protein
MSVIIILIAASLIIASGFLIAFIWSIKNGQFDDDYTPSVRILFDDIPSQEKTEKSINKEQNNQTKTKQPNL